jgi:hypothetical protein
MVTVPTGEDTHEAQ